jgi:hypothetical protein
MEKQMDVALKNLSRTLLEIETLSAWLALERSERTESTDHSFQWNSSTKEDLKAKVGAFLNAYYTILEAVKKSDRGNKAAVRLRLQEVYRSFHRLAVPINL